MNKIQNLWIVMVFTLLIVACANTSTKETKVLISTNKGDIVLKLYNETPLHRDNFIKLVKDGYYEELLFHRVINNFMIQGGDPESKDASKRKKLGDGGPGYQIDAEIIDTLYHKKGALAAAREGDRKNPLRKSDGSQFYIVQGKVFTSEELDEIEAKLYYQAIEKEKQQLADEKKGTFIILQNSGNYDQITELEIAIDEEANKKVNRDSFKLSEAQRKLYSSIGGVPHLDGAYTIFGEVIEGLAVIDSIATVETNKHDRPIEDVVMKIEIIKE